MIVVQHPNMTNKPLKHAAISQPATAFHSDAFCSQRLSQTRPEPINTYENHLIDGV